MVLKIISKRNVDKVLLLLNNTGEMYFNEIQKELDLNAGTLTRIVSDLMEYKFIYKRVEDESKHLSKTYYGITDLGKKAIEIYKIKHEIEEELK